MSDEESVRLLHQNLKTSKVGAYTVLAGRIFHFRTVEKEFDSICSLIRSWNSPAVLWYARRRFGGTCLR